MVDRSESLVRAIEGGRMEMSQKFAKALSERTGVSKSWLLLPDVEGENVPSAAGGPLNHIEVLNRITGKLHLDSSIGIGKSHINFSRIMAANMSKVVEEALQLSLDRGDTRLMEEITRLLARQHGESV